MKPLIDRNFGEFQSAFSLLESNHHRHHWQALLEALVFEEADLMALHDSLYSNSVSISRALQHRLTEVLIQLGAERKVSITDSKSPFLNWALDWKLGGIGIDFFTGNRGAAATRLLRLASAISDKKSHAEVGVGVMIFLSQRAKIRGNLDTTVPTWEEAVLQQPLFEPFIRSPIALIGLDGPFSFQIERLKRQDRKSRCLLLDPDLD